MSLWSHYFLGIDLPAKARRALVQSLKPLLSEKGLAFQQIPAPVLSLPLVLLGDQPRESGELIRMITRRSTRDCGEMQLSAKRWLVQRSEDRWLLSLEVKDRYQQLSFLTRVINQALQDEGFESAERGFAARIPCGIAHAQITPPRQLPRFQVEVDQLSLFERPEDYRRGSSYRIVWTAPLAADLLDLTSSPFGERDDSLDRGEDLHRTDEDAVQGRERRRREIEAELNEALPPLYQSAQTSSNANQRAEGARLSGADQRYSSSPITAAGEQSDSVQGETATTQEPKQPERLSMRQRREDR